MTWRYVATVTRGEGEDIYEIRELYDLDGKISWTKDPIPARGSTLEELITDLQRMKDDAANHPALDIDAARDEAEETLADPEHYQRVYREENTPCPVEGCRLSAQEHHRLAYGWLQELRTLRAERRD